MFYFHATSHTRLNCGSVAVTVHADSKDRLLTVVNGDVCCPVTVHSYHVCTPTDQLTVRSSRHAYGEKMKGSYHWCVYVLMKSCCYCYYYYYYHHHHYYSPVCSVLSKDPHLDMAKKPLSPREKATLSPS